MIFNKKIILKFLEYAEDSRNTQYKLKSKYPSCEYIDDEKTDTQGFMLIVSNKGLKEAIIAFRGSQQIRDWLTDLNAWQVEYPYENRDTSIRVHKGFMNSYRSVRAQIHNFIAENDVKVVHVCGHSLGGALATLCSVDLQYNFDIMVSCFSSGNPMVGNRAFVKSYNRRVPNSVRTYVRGDIVPKMPPKLFWRLTGKFSHAGQSNPIGSPHPLMGLLFLLKNQFVKESFIANITNHSIELYKKYLY